MISFWLAGCIPCQQYRVVEIDQGEYAHFDYNGEYGLFTMEGVKQLTLDDSKSFAIGPKNKKYAIRSMPHQYDLEMGHDFVRTKIYVLKNDGRPFGRLPKGVWSFSFYYSNLDEEGTYSCRAKLWTFWYSPLIHGPPN